MALEIPCPLTLPILRTEDMHGVMKTPLRHRQSVRRFLRIDRGCGRCCMMFIAGVVVKSSTRSLERSSGSGVTGSTTIEALLQRPRPSCKESPRKGAACCKCAMCRRSRTHINFRSEADVQNGLLETSVRIQIHSSKPHRAEMMDSTNNLAAVVTIDLCMVSSVAAWKPLEGVS